MKHNPDDLRMAFTTEEGVKVEIYDTYCKHFTPEDKEALDAKINDILYRSERRRQLATISGAGAGA